MIEFKLKKKNNRMVGLKPILYVIVFQNTGNIVDSKGKTTFFGIATPTYLVVLTT